MLALSYQTVHAYLVQNVRLIDGEEYNSTRFIALPEINRTFSIVAKEELNVNVKINSLLNCSAQEIKANLDKVYGNDL